MAQHGHLTRKEKKEIRKKRRELRKDLKKRGIKSRAEFEVIAQQMGLVYGGSSGGLLGFFWRIANFLRMTGALWALLGLLGVLALVGIYARMANAKGDFTISLSGDLTKKGFVLSETEDFANPQVRLKATPLQEVGAESIKNIPEDLDNGAGSHNLDDVMAYTFWIKNAGDEILTYNWDIVLNDVKNNVDSATWIMLYREKDTNDDRQEHDPADENETYDGNDRNTSDRVMTIYAKPLEDGTDEHLSGYSSALFQNVAADSSQNYQKSGKYGIRTTPYLSDREVAKGTEDQFWPGEIHKYTLVMWVEGDDPDCTNELLGGKVSYAMKFGIEEENNGIFDDLMDIGDDTASGQQE